MKLIGNSSGRHMQNQRTSNNRSAPRNSTISPERAQAGGRRNRRSLSGMQKFLRILIIFICLVFVLGGSALAIVRWQIEPFYEFFFRPDVNVLAVHIDDEVDNTVVVNPDNPEEVITIAEERVGERGARLAPVEERNSDIFTFLVLGIDHYSNTDVIMVATFDSVESTLEVVSIPRDTLVNVSWNLRKANSIMANMRHRFRNDDNTEETAMQATVEHFSDLLGFNVDFWVTLTPQAFTRLIDAVGPIDFYVPANMYEYGVRVNRGQQRLNGVQALTVMKTRRVYANADIGRINTQQDFMHVLASQIIAGRDQISVQDYADIFIGNVRTDIQLNHLVWLGREFLSLDPEDINFTIMPHELITANGTSYVGVLVDEWLEIINEKLSPLNREITAEDVSILTRDANSRRLFVTDGEWRGNTGWGGGPG